MKYALIGCGRVSKNHIKAATLNNLEIELLQNHINDLPKRLQIIVKYRLNGLTQMEIASILNISQAQVSRLHAEALNMLRYKFKMNEGGDI